MPEHEQRKGEREHRQQKRVILICGRKGAGKDTLAGAITRAGVRMGVDVMIDRLAFADPIKRIVANVLGVPPTVLWGTDAQKEAYQVYGKSARHWMQWVGTEVFRDGVDPNIWADAAVRQIASSSAGLFILTDLRFPNEVEVVGRVATPYVVRVERASLGEPVDSHRSETSGDAIPIDLVVHNDGPVADLDEPAEAILVDVLFGRTAAS